MLQLKDEKEEVLSKVESELAEDKHKEEQRKQRVKEQIEEEKRHRFGQLNAWKASKARCSF